MMTLRRKKKKAGKVTPPSGNPYPLVQLSASPFAPQPEPQDGVDSPAQAPLTSFQAGRNPVSAAKPNREGNLPDRDAKTKFLSLTTRGF